MYLYTYSASECVEHYLNVNLVVTILKTRRTSSTSKMYEDCKSRFVCYNHVDPILFIRSFFMILILTFIVIFIFEFEFLYSCCTILNIIDEMIPCSSFMYGTKKGDKECICISYTQATYTSKTFHNCAEI